MRKLLFFTLFTTAFFACADKEAALRERLAALDKEFGGANVTDKKKAEEFIAAAEQLAGIVEKTNLDEYVDLMLKAAGLAKTIEKPEKAIELYSKVTEKMPQHLKAPTAFFMLGFVYGNDLRDLEKAKAAYELFLQKFPNDEMAESARAELLLLGKSPDEALKEILKNNPDSLQAN
jgi:tetratricopeptide (TPR) repeat protein